MDQLALAIESLIQRHTQDVGAKDLVSHQDVHTRFRTRRPDEVSSDGPTAPASVRFLGPFLWGPYDEK